MRAPELAARYERLLAEHGPALRRVAGSYEADRALREDLFQDICLAIWQALPKFRGDSSERTFIFRIGHNRGLSHSWRRRPAATDLDEAEAMADPLPGPEAAANASQRRKRLRAAVRSLPLAARQVVSLSLEGVSQREIGDILGIRENNVAVRLHRAKAALRRALESSGKGSL
ncbi:MAG: sigma-70 family RNA polymerase sigma factor [Acidobacteriota bacterium]